MKFCLGFAQTNHNDLTIGLSYGFGSELTNKDYKFSNQFYKAEFHYVLKESKLVKYEFVLEPELNRAKHRLVNPLFYSVDDPDYQEKWGYFSKGISINHYILNVGLIFRKPLFKGVSIYFLGSAGPMYIDKETERQSKGFCFSHTLAVGLSVTFDKVIIDIRPGFRHVSNAGLKSPNLGYNTTNLEFGLAYVL